MPNQHANKTLIPANVGIAIGADRAAALMRVLGRLDEQAAAAPTSTTWAMLRPVVATDSDPERGITEVMARLEAASRASKRTLTYVLGNWPDGRAFAMACDLVAGAPGVDAAVQLQLFEIHSRLAGWYLTALWRAHELLNVLVEAIAEWRIVTAAAVSRALLEGVAAFWVESARMGDAWQQMKLKGAPGCFEVEEFKKSLGDTLFEAQFGTRIGQTGVKKTAVARNRTNVMTLLGNFAKAIGRKDEVDRLYEWLCDAVHPSYGFQTVFTARTLIDEQGTHVLVESNRHAVSDAREVETSPTVAWAAIDAAVLAVDSWVPAASRFLSVVDDYGLTTGVPFTTVFDYYRKFPRPLPGRPCPCGSGQIFRTCFHRWGVPMPETAGGKVK